MFNANSEFYGVDSCANESELAAHAELEASEPNVIPVLFDVMVREPRTHRLVASLMTVPFPKAEAFRLQWEQEFPGYVVDMSRAFW